MEHYKIIKKTFYGIDEHGIKEQSVYKAYHKWFIFWLRLKTVEMYHDGSTLLNTNNASFKNIESAENFIKIYHEHRYKIGNYTIETVKKIDLK